MDAPKNPRLLVIEDAIEKDGAIRTELRKILQSPAAARPFEIDSAPWGDAGLRLVEKSLEASDPYTAVIVDASRVSGTDAVEACEKLRSVDPQLEIVITTASPDAPWEEIVAGLGPAPRFMILRQPFHPVEIRQLAGALAEKQELALAVEKATAAAVAANRAKLEFLSNMSHEIRTPMTAILGYADLLCESELGGEEIAQHVRTIQANRDRLLKLFDDILDVAKLERRAMVLESVRCSPAAILREAVAILNLRAGEKGLMLTFGSADAIPESVVADPARLRQILLNLIANAIQFTERGGVDIRVRLLPARDARGSALAFDVTDTGVGLTREQKDRLFLPFSQADSSTARRSGGSGLGLCISLRLAEMMGGSIAVQSSPGSGSTFTATIETGPLAGIRMVHLKDDHEVPADRSEKAPSPGMRLSGRILLAEDGRDNQRLIQLYLARAGASVEIASDGAEAHAKALIAMAVGRPHDLILMDMQMPQMDGYEATRRLRIDGYKGPIVALTAHAMSGDRERCLEAGCDDYAVKPIDRLKLIELCAAKISGPDGVRAPLPAQSPSTARSFLDATLR